MSWLQNLFLGVLQALTEFLPISSSGHLVLGKHFLNIITPGTALEVVLHMGTLCSILVYYFRDLLDVSKGLFSKDNTESRNLVFAVLIGTIPAVIVGFGFEDIIDEMFSSVQLVSFSMIFTGIVLFSTKFRKNNNQDIVTLQQGFLIGCAQALAITPGISRSGMTISIAILIGISNRHAAKFSFFLAIPALFGAGILKLDDAMALIHEVSTVTLAVGFISSFIVGYLVIDLLIKLISKDKFWMFAIYCWGVGLISLLISI
ncbi:MAG: undecaprenyl-diphosphatase UppP [FCB group bacterium]|nr:undecaprenyl-diphosphatase UppP [FCB group bacterium]